MASFLFRAVAIAIVCLASRRVQALAPSDSYSDGDLAQSGYLGGNHNIDPDTLAASSFGIQWNFTPESGGLFYARPLVYTPTATSKQVVFLASNQNYVRTLDAVTGELINERQVQTPFKASDTGCGDFGDTVGITGTPIIDPNTDIAYFLAKSYIPNYREPGDTGYKNGVYYFYAVNVNTLKDVKGYPILVDGSKADNDARRTFIGGLVVQEPSLVQVGNFVYAGFGVDCNYLNATGTILGVDVTKAQLVSHFATESGPDAPYSEEWVTMGGGGGAGIYQSGMGLSTDGSRLFLTTGSSFGRGNGPDPASGSSGLQILGDTVVDFDVAANGKLSVTDYFQPYDYHELAPANISFGSSGVSILDPTVFKGRKTSRIALASGRSGKVYVMNANNLGGYQQGPAETDFILQTISLNSSVYGGSGSYPLGGGYIYAAGLNTPLYAFKFTSPPRAKPRFTLAGKSNEVSSGAIGPGIPTVTSNQGRDGSGLVWMSDPDAGLRVWRAVPGDDGKLISIPLPALSGANYVQKPVFGNGRVYVTGEDGSLSCLGLDVQLPMDCTPVDFGRVVIGTVVELTMNCTTNVDMELNRARNIAPASGRFRVSDVRDYSGPLSNGTQLSFDTVLDLTNDTIKSPVRSGHIDYVLTLVANHNDTRYSKEISVEISVQAVSDGPLFYLDPPELDLGGVIVESSMRSVSSTNGTFDMTNNGNATLRISGYAYINVGSASSGPDAKWTNATQDEVTSVWNLGAGFSSDDLPAIDSTIPAFSSVSVPVTFRPTNGTGDYSSRFAVYTDGGDGIVLIEAMASSSQHTVLQFSSVDGSSPSADDTTMDFGPVSPGSVSIRSIQICNTGRPLLTITTSIPPTSGVISAAGAADELYVGEEIPSNQCVTSGVVFIAPKHVVNSAMNTTYSDTWTLDTDDSAFGGRTLTISGTVVSDTVGPTFANGTARYSYLGCYRDANPRLLPHSGFSPEKSLDNGACMNACYAEGYTFAGTEASDECWCGNYPPRGASYSPDGCDLECAGDASQICGGHGGPFISIYYDTTAYNVSKYTFENIPTDTVQTVGGFSFVGCFDDSSSTRTLSEKMPRIPDSGMTVNYCSRKCAAYDFFGVEFGNECYCSNDLSSSATMYKGTLANETGCNMPCYGDQTQYCGGSARINIYQAASAPKPFTGGLAINAAIGNFTFTDCFAEPPNARALKGASTSSDTMTQQSCIAFCSEYHYAALEYSSQCFCGDRLADGSAVARDDRCSMPCTGDDTQLCGGPLGLTLYENQDPARSARRAPAILPSTGPYSYAGCYTEQTGGKPRALRANATAADNMTVDACGRFCANYEGSSYSLFGVEYARECYCDEEVGGDSEVVDDAECDMPCAGDVSQLCGGPNRLNVYKLSF